MYSNPDMSILTKILGDPHTKQLRAFREIVVRINAREEVLVRMSDADLQKHFIDIRDRLRKSPSEELEHAMEDVFAIAREAGKRALGLRMFDVQFMGSIALFRGSIAEMKTGEGKTLAAVPAMILRGMKGKSAHLVTVNDYLARRDARWMGKIYTSLGLSVGCIQHDSAFLVDAGITDAPHGFEGLRPVERREAYLADIVYGTNNEFGFDYLRDNMVQDPSQRVQRDRAFAIVDEVDSILIDEARTPLIISAPAEEATDEYQKYARIVQQLQENADYNVDEKAKAATLTEQGMTVIEKLLNIPTIYDANGIAIAHHIEQALKAKSLFLRDRDYVVKEGEVIIVDPFTGRLMPGRRYSEGLHQAIEAKEGVTIQRENRTFATITFQNYFRLYSTLSGMTGTAATEAEEFAKIYGLDVNVIPTNKELNRTDKPDYIYKHEQAKFRAVVEEIKQRRKKGQPVLVGTVAIEKSEALSSVLTQEGIGHEVLNAKQHQKEAEIIAQAGQKGAVTISTNMAGRGTDIVLGGEPYNEDKAIEVRALGGLYVIGTERHEARRIDNQLRGRSGRQGDPGETRFFVSLDDSLLRIFGSDRLKSAMQLLKLPDDQPIENTMITRALESAQKRVEGHHFDARKHLVEYDDVMNTHREVIYKRRNAIVDLDIQTDAPHDMMQTLFIAEAHRIVDWHAPMQGEWNFSELRENAKTLTGLPESDILGLEDADQRDETRREALRQSLTTLLTSQYQKLCAEQQDPSVMRRVARAVMLRTIDVFWIEHLEQMTHLRESIGLQGYGQRDPLIEYKKRSFDLFQELLVHIDHQIVNTILKVRITAQAPKASVESPMKKIERKESVVDAEKKIGRNDPCPCGAKYPDGRSMKYKHCHGRNA